MKGKKFNKKFSSKKGKFPGKFQDKKKKPVDRAPAVSATIAEAIKNGSRGESFKITGIVGSISQTPGPTIFNVSDGTGTLALKAFAGAGERAYPEIEESSSVTANITLEEFRDQLEGEVSSMKKLSDEDHEYLLKKMKEIELERARIDPPEFLIKDKILDKLREKFIDAATQIRLAVIQNRPIIVRHHNDADGYSSGFALEKAILPLIEEQHGGGKSAWEFFMRAPSQAPFYEIDDSIRDTATSLRNEAKFSNKMPLVIIADNGSSGEDLFGIQQGKVHGIDFIVVDHHVLGDKDVISKEVLVHINPFLVGESGEEFSAGMLCAELSRFINPKTENNEQIAAMAGMADRTKNEPAIKQYLVLSAKKGYDKPLLSKISSVLDFVSTRLRFMEAREYIEVLFGEPVDKQKKLVALMGPYISNLESKGLEIGKKFAKIEKIGKITLQTIMMDESFPGFGFYPRPGIVINMLHDNIQKEKNLSSVISMGILGTAITMRATDKANFSVHDLIKHLNKKIPDAFVTGGGHKNAGAINFIPIRQQEIFKEAKAYIKSL
tara:strand:- start:3711 stop:5363 length:1653 start_codon:yes stop_codon:yes gene_type:complete